MFEANASIEADVKFPTFGVDPEDAARAVKLISESEADPKKLTEILIATYLTARLHDVPDLVREVAIHLALRNLRERDELFDFTETQGTVYRVDDQRFRFSLRKQDADTILVGYMFAHEFEHMMQHLTVGGHRISRIMQPGADVTKIEEGAMRAEFVFLQLIPRAVREKFLSDHMIPGARHSPTFDLFLGALGASLKTTDPTTYVKAMWFVNRYRPHGF